jgi:hypothetical protein
LDKLIDVPDPFYVHEVGECRGPNPPVYVMLTCGMHRSPGRVDLKSGAYVLTLNESRWEQIVSVHEAGHVLIGFGHARYSPSVMRSIVGPVRSPTIEDLRFLLRRHSELTQ